MNDFEGVLPASIFMDMERSGPMPLYYQVASRIEAAIHNGELGPGTRLETEIALGVRLGLSRPTIRRAIQELVDKGLLVRRRGIGTQVVQGKVMRDLQLTSLYEDLLRDNKAPKTQVLLHEVLDADAVLAERLNVEVGSPVLHLRRLRTADGIPMAILDNTLPAAFVDITENELASAGLYQVLRGRGVAMRIARQQISARLATAEESTLLGIPKDGALLSMDRTAFDSSGAVVEWGHHCYRPDFYSFEITLLDK